VLLFLSQEEGTAMSGWNRHDAVGDLLDVLREIRDRMPEKEVPLLQMEADTFIPLSITTPDGPLVGYIDEANQEHWKRPTWIAPVGWKLLYVKRKS
jgi:hypothetical protein